MTDPKRTGSAATGAGLRGSEKLDAAAAKAEVWPIIKRVFRSYIWTQRRWLILAIVAMLFNSAATGVIPVLLRDAADKIFNAHDTAYLYMLPPAIIVIMVARSTADFFAKVYQAHLTARMIATVRTEIFTKLTRADLSWLQSMNSGRFVTMFMSDVNSMNNVASQTLTTLAQNGLQVVFLIGAMFYLDWRLTLFVVAVLPVGIILTREQRRRIKINIRAMMSEVGSIGTMVSEMLSAVRVVKAYHQEDVETKRAHKTIEKALRITMKMQRARAMTGPIAETLGGIGIGAAIFYGGWQGIAGRLTLGEFMGFISAAMLCYQPFKALAGTFNQISEGAVAAARIFSVIDRTESIMDLPGAKPLAVPKGAIRFENVTFSYDGKTDVLTGLTLDIPAGQRVALVGPSGAGKSTIINLILRFYDPTEGRILIDGEDIRTATLGSVRRASALLTQDPVLFDDTIDTNIRYGSPSATAADVERAARLAAAHDFIMALPKGYDTDVGQAGQFLSGGQRQRIAFARAMLRNAPILLLDEPTSALDAESESIIQDGLDRLSREKTVVIIAHRLSTIRKADIIVVMERGQIVETGRHDELLAKGGLYDRLYRAQFASEHVDALPDEAEIVARAEAGEALP